MEDIGQFKHFFNWSISSRRNIVDHHLLCIKNVISLHISYNILIALCKSFPIRITWITIYSNSLMQLGKKVEKLGVKVFRFTPEYPAFCSESAVVAF